MHGLGTIVNVAAIVVGGLAGLLGGRRIPEQLQKTLMSAMGVSVLFVGVSGTLSQMLRAGGGALTVQGTMMILSLAVGAVLGELLDLEDRMERFGAWLKVKTKSESDGGFIGAFVTASLTVCIGAMAIVGSIQDGILGDHATLFAKAVLDLVIIMVMTASMGKGCIFSAIPVGILQGSVTLLARLLQPVFTDAALSNLSLVGSVLVFCVGLNLVWGKKIRVANLLPSLLIAVIWAFL
jgi:putative membrane protein